MSKGIKFNTKQLRISRDQFLTAVATAIIAIVLIATYFVTTRFLAIIEYQNRSIRTIETNIATIKQIDKDKDVLISQFNQFNAGKVIPTVDDGTNHSIVLRALPYRYTEANKTEWENKYSNFLKRDGEAYDYGEASWTIKEPMQEAITIGDVDGIQIVPMSLTVPGLRRACIEPQDICLDKLFRDLDRISSPIKIVGISIDKNVDIPLEADVPDDIPLEELIAQSVGDSLTNSLTFTAHLELETYIRPRVDITLEEEAVVPKKDN